MMAVVVKFVGQQPAEFVFEGPEGAFGGALPAGTHCYGHAVHCSGHSSTSGHQ